MGVMGGMMSRPLARYCACGIVMSWGMPGGMRRSSAAKYNLCERDEVSLTTRYLSQVEEKKSNLGAGTSGLTVCMAMQLSGCMRAMERAMLNPLTDLSSAMRPLRLGKTC